MKPVLVCTLDRQGNNWKFFFGFDLGEDGPKCHHLIYFEGGNVYRASIEHLNQRCSMHYFVYLDEAGLAMEEVNRSIGSWSYPQLQESLNDAEDFVNAIKWPMGE